MATPGAVIAPHVEPGRVVKRSDVLVVTESMKMETAICTGLDGVVRRQRPERDLERQDPDH